MPGLRRRRLRGGHSRGAAEEPWSVLRSSDNADVAGLSCILWVPGGPETERGSRRPAMGTIAQARHRQSWLARSTVHRRHGATVRCRRLLLDFGSVFHAELWCVVVCSQRVTSVCRHPRAAPCTVAESRGHSKYVCSAAIPSPACLPSLRWGVFFFFPPLSPFCFSALYAPCLNQRVCVRSCVHVHRYVYANAKVSVHKWWKAQPCRLLLSPLTRVSPLLHFVFGGSFFSPCLLLWGSRTSAHPFVTRHSPQTQLHHTQSWCCRRWLHRAFSCRCHSPRHRGLPRCRLRPTTTVPALRIRRPSPRWSRSRLGTAALAC
jgi:hypothetical protein